MGGGGAGDEVHGAGGDFPAGQFGAAGAEGEEVVFVDLGGGGRLQPAVGQEVGAGGGGSREGDKGSTNKYTHVHMNS